MDSERVQPGGRVDKETYERFRGFVKSKHGAVRGNLGTELTKAMEDRMDITKENSQLTRIENDVATIKAQLSHPESDGGEVVEAGSRNEDTRTRKPAANRPRDEKVSYLICELIENVTASACDRNGGQLSYKELRNTIQSEYNFTDDIQEEYEELIINELSAEPHPVHGNTIVWGTEIQKIEDEIREKRKAEAEQKL
jgi:hypothetical protein